MKRKRFKAKAKGDWSAPFVSCVGSSSKAGDCSLSLLLKVLPMAAPLDKCLLSLPAKSEWSSALGLALTSSQNQDLKDLISRTYVARDPCTPLTATTATSPRLGGKIGVVSCSQRELVNLAVRKLIHRHIRTSRSI